MTIPLDFAPAETLCDQGFRFRPSWWTNRLSDPTWGDWLGDLPEAGGGYRRIRRATLLDMPTVEHPAKWPRTLVAAYAWGTGPSGFLVGRRARVFGAEPERISQALTNAATVLRDSGPEEAYDSMLRGGSNNLKYLGPSFFTKFLYAADARPSEPGRALILDQFVAVALNKLHGWGIDQLGPWSASTYARWLDFAQRQAEQASERTAHFVRADAVEMAYFEYGRTVVKGP